MQISEHSTKSVDVFDVCQMIRTNDSWPGSVVSVCCFWLVCSGSSCWPTVCCRLIRCFSVCNFMCCVPVYRAGFGIPIDNGLTEFDADGSEPLDAPNENNEICVFRF